MFARNTWIIHSVLKSIFSIWIEIFLCTFHFSVLMLTICKGVTHAHHKTMLHRDVYTNRVNAPPVLTAYSQFPPPEDRKMSEVSLRDLWVCWDSTNQNSVTCIKATHLSYACMITGASTVHFAKMSNPNYEI